MTRQSPHLARAVSLPGEVQHKAQRVGRNCFVQFYGPSDNEIYGTKPIFVNKINESVQTLLG
jgi:hypothetical protein